MEKVKSFSMLQTGFVFLQLVLMHKMCHAQTSTEIQQLTDAVKLLSESMEKVKYYLERAEAFRTYTNVAVWKIATQSSTHEPNSYAIRAVDNNLDSEYHHWSCSQTNDEKHRRPWWQVDLSQAYPVYMVVITNRNKYGDRLHNFQVLISLSDPLFHTSTLCYTFSGAAQSGVTLNLPCTNAPINGRYVRVLNGLDLSLTLCEVQVLSK